MSKTDTTIDFYKFQDCYKQEKNKEAPGAAYVTCLKSHKSVERINRGPVLPDGKPGHNLYDVSEGASLKIDKMLENFKETQC